MRGTFACCALGVLALVGCGSGSTDIGANTGCGRFLSMSKEDQERATELMQRNRGKGTSPSKLTAASDAARALCNGEGSLGSINDIYDAVHHGRPTQTASTPTPASDFTPSRTYEWGVASYSKSSARITIEVGDLVAAENGNLPATFEEFRSICETDPQRDALLPIHMVATNTTDGFDAELKVNVITRTLKSSFGSTPALGSASTFTDGPRCDEPEGVGSQTQVAGVNFGEMTPNETKTHDWLLVIKDYYSPANPDGNEALLSQLAAGINVPSFASAEDVIPNTTCFSGTADRFYRGSFQLHGLGIWGAWPLADVKPDSREAGPKDPPKCETAGDSRSPAVSSFDQSLAERTAERWVASSDAATGCELMTRKYLRDLHGSRSKCRNSSGWHAGDRSVVRAVSAGSHWNIVFSSPSGDRSWVAVRLEDGQPKIAHDNPCGSEYGFTCDE